MTAIAVAVSGALCRLLDGPSEVEAENAAEIDAVWRAAHADKPETFNGRILLAEAVELDGDVLRADFRECAFATLLWLRGQRASPPPLYNVFGAAAVLSRDGAFLLGRMAPHTSNAGQIYFPCGTPDPGDAAEGLVDLEGSIARELCEETGLAAPLVHPTPRSVAVFDAHLVGFVRRFDSDLDAAALEAQARAHLAQEARPELDGVVMARDPAALGDATRTFVRMAMGALLGD